MGYTAEELIGQHCIDNVVPELVPQIEEESTKRLQGIAGRYETVLLTREGQRVPVVINAYPLFDGGQFIGVLSAFRDITRHKQV